MLAATVIIEGRFLAPAGSSTAALHQAGIKQ